MGILMEKLMSLARSCTESCWENCRAKRENELGVGVGISRDLFFQCEIKGSSLSLAHGQLELSKGKIDIKRFAMI